MLFTLLLSTVGGAGWVAVVDEDRVGDAVRVEGAWL